ncbi:MAG: hypothetical protein N3A67_05805 [Ignavibacteria bacterium]|nr:hypothetical protein [Ignavibacteria bacterium]
MKKITIVLVFLLAFGCKSIYERAPQMRSFGCELPPIVFLEKINGLSQLEGFFVAELDTNSNNCLLVLQKNLTIKGSANDREIVADQIRFRYSQLDKTVWYSTGIFKSYKGKTSYLPPTADDSARHNSSVNLTLDRLFMQCNPGKKLERK